MKFEHFSVLKVLLGGARRRLELFRAQAVGGSSRSKGLKS